MPQSVVVTAPFRRRVVIRAPYRAGMRARLAEAGGTPQWESCPGVWTVPWTSLAPAVRILLEVFDTVTVQVETDSADTDRWIRYDLAAAEEAALLS